MPNTEAAAQELSNALPWGEEAMAPLRLVVGVSPAAVSRYLEPEISVLPAESIGGW